jgi:molybdopterin molybdotransferase
VIEFEKARRLILSAAKPLGEESVPLNEALGRVCARAVAAASDLVPFARSAMDGFAVAATDLSRAPVRLPVTATVFAGDAGAPEQRAGTATRIATGAPLPQGADAVVPVECVRAHNGHVEIDEPLQSGEHVFPPAEDARRGDLLVQRGDVIDAGRIGLLAADGKAAVAVFKLPRVAIACTGDELVRIDESPKHGQVRNSNAPMLAAAVKQSGALSVHESWVRDEPAALRHVLEEALAVADVLVTSGGASAGERDYVKNALRALGFEFLFSSVAMRPGRPSAFGRKAEKLAAVLPGNPAAAYTAFMQLAAPALRMLGGRRPTQAPALRAKLTRALSGKEGLQLFVFAQLRAEYDGSLSVEPLANQCSALVRTAADANCFVRLPPEKRQWQPGDSVAVELLRWEDVSLAVLAD